MRPLNLLFAGNCWQKSGLWSPNERYRTQACNRGKSFPSAIELFEAAGAIDAPVALRFPRRPQHCSSSSSLCLRAERRGSAEEEKLRACRPRVVFHSSARILSATTASSSGVRIGFPRWFVSTSRRMSGGRNERSEIVIVGLPSQRASF